jgi:hypothetical protein
VENAILGYLMDQPFKDVYQLIDGFPTEMDKHIPAGVKIAVYETGEIFSGLLDASKNPSCPDIYLGTFRF